MQKILSSQCHLIDIHYMFSFLRIVFSFITYLTLQLSVFVLIFLQCFVSFILLQLVIVVFLGLVLFATTKTIVPCTKLVWSRLDLCELWYWSDWDPPNFQVLLRLEASRKWDPQKKLGLEVRRNSLTIGWWLNCCFVTVFLKGVEFLKCIQTHYNINFKYKLYLWDTH